MEPNTLFTMALCLTLTTYVNSVATASTVSHPLKFYNSCALERLVADPDESKMKHFWAGHLRPMLRQRVPGTEGNVYVRQHIINSFSHLKIWHLDLDTFTENTVIGEVQFTNIIVTQVPEKRKKLTLACHYDSKLMEGFIAATDSAVPCALIMDLAQRLDDWLKHGNGDKAKDYSLRLLFFDGEEAFQSWTETDSIYGSRHLAHLWETEPDDVDPSKSKLDTISSFILLDLIGERGMTFHNFFENTAPLFEGLEKAEKKLHKETSMSSQRKMFSDTKIVSKQYRIEDDHIPFLRRGVPVLHLIAVPFPSTWHTINDREDRLDWREIENFSKILRVFLSQFLHLKVKGCDRNGLH